MLKNINDVDGDTLRCIVIRKVANIKVMSLRIQTTECEIDGDTVWEKLKNADLSRDSRGHQGFCQIELQKLQIIANHCKSCQILALLANACMVCLY